MTLPPNLNVYITAALFVMGAYLFALYLGLVVWTFRDIRARSRDVLAQILATLLVAVFTLPGLLVYLLLRPHTTVAEEYERDLAEEAILQDLDQRRICPECRRRVEADFIICPECHHQLRLRCSGCSRLLDLHWDVCPYCGQYTDSETEDADLVTSGAARGRGASGQAMAADALAVPEPLSPSFLPEDTPSSGSAERSGFPAEDEEGEE